MGEVSFEYLLALVIVQVLIFTYKVVSKGAMEDVTNRQDKVDTEVENQQTLIKSLQDRLLEEIKGNKELFEKILGLTESVASIKEELAILNGKQMQAEERLRTQGDIIQTQEKQINELQAILTTVKQERDDLAIDNAKLSGRIEAVNELYKETLYILRGENNARPSVKPVE